MLQLEVRRTFATRRPMTTLATAFLVSDIGHVLTAGHVVPPRDNDHIAVHYSVILHALGPHSVKAELIEVFPNMDVAVLKVDPYPGWRAFCFGDSDELRPGDELFALGHPQGERLSVLQGRLVYAGGAHWQTDLGIRGGSSGSPVLNRSGRVVAVAVAGEHGTELVKYVVPERHFTHLRMNWRAPRHCGTNQMADVLPKPGTPVLPPAIEKQPPTPTKAATSSLWCRYYRWLPCARQ